MNNEKTTSFNVKGIDRQLVKNILKDVYEALDDRGYNPTNQIVGYLISGDPGYISGYNNARNKIQQIERAKIVEILLEDFYSSID